MDNRVFALILRHPQEQDRDLGTAPLLMAQLKNARLATGLSWPNLARALNAPAEPKRWGVLYLGSAQLGRDQAEITMVDREGSPLPSQDSMLSDLEGIVLLDGNWSQAKALWWRNPWLLKLRRLVLAPRQASRYGKLRREPRRESVSTIEAAALCLARLEQDPGLAQRLLQPFDLLLEKYRQSTKA